MRMVMWGIDSFHGVDLMTSQGNFDSQYFVHNIMVSLVQKVFPKRRNPHVRPYLYLNPCSVHFSKVSEQFIGQNHILRVAQKLYPDLAPSAFCLFGHLKNSVIGQTSDELVELLECITSLLGSLQLSESQVVFSHWIHRIRWMLEDNRDHSHE
jgi:hypothetical protein